jgi:hypothetical protein
MAVLFTFVCVTGLVSACNLSLVSTSQQPAGLHVSTQSIMIHKKTDTKQCRHRSAPNYPCSTHCNHF